MFLDGVVGAVTKTDARARTHFLSKLGCIKNFMIALVACSLHLVCMKFACLCPNIHWLLHTPGKGATQKPKMKHVQVQSENGLNLVHTASVHSYLSGKSWRVFGNKSDVPCKRRDSDHSTQRRFFPAGQGIYISPRWRKTSVGCMGTSQWRGYSLISVSSWSCFFRWTVGNCCLCTGQWIHGLTPATAT